mgnify:FL=1
MKKDINLQIEENLKKEMNVISNKISVLVDLQKTRSKDLQIQINRLNSKIKKQIAQ